MTLTSTAPSRSRRRWEKADFAQRRTLILEAALGLLTRRGPHEVTIRRVAQRLGVGAMTLYTYFRGQDELRREMTRLGFEQLATACRDASSLGTRRGWRGGAAAYVQFAIENPNLYELMFRMPYASAPADQEILEGGFRNLLDRVLERFEGKGLSGSELNRQARAAAGRFWIALHGLASLAIAGRLVVLDDDLDGLLEDLIPRVQPDQGYD